MTYEDIKNIYPLIKGDNIKMYQPFLNKWMSHYGITTPERQAHFIAQIMHESSFFRRTEENLNYSALGLLSTFPSRFTKKEAFMYAGMPEQIANRAYANKGGNGDEHSGDGWKYRGRGLMQITLKDNYKELSADWGIDVLNHPDLLKIPEWAVRSACWYWWKRGLNKIADTGSVKDVTRKINTGLLGLKEREDLFKKAILIFKK